MWDVSAIREELGALLEDGVFITDKTGVKTIELVGESFVADEPTIFGEINHDWHEREIRWYNSQSRSVYDIEHPIPQIWKQVADQDGIINSNYGWCIYSAENGSQYAEVRDELRKNPESRRAVAIYTRPTMWKEYNHEGRSDFICTNAVQYLVRRGKVHAIVQMRSSDAIFGYKGDLYWQQYVLKDLAFDLGVGIGEVIWQAGSLHVYERHFFLVDHWSKTGEVSIRKEDYRKRYPGSPWA